MTVDEFSPPNEEDEPLELEEPRHFQQGVTGEEEGPDRADRPEEEAPPRGRRRVAVLLVLVAALVAVEVGATLIQHGSVPREAHWRAAAAKVLAERDRRDPVLFAPHWVDPLGRFYLGEQLDMEQLLLSDVDRHRRVFLVSIRDRGHPWLGGERPAKEWSFGGVKVSLFERKEPATVLYDFTRRIREAQVSRIGRDVHRCRWNDGRRRFACDPSRSWNWVGPHLAEVGHRPYRCIFAHAVDGQVMRITFPAAKMGRQLVGYTGIDDFENRKRSKAVVMLKLFAGPKPIYTVRHENRWPWRRFTVDTREIKGQTHPVSFEVSSPHAFARTFCFAAETRE